MTHFIICTYIIIKYRKTAHLNEIMITLWSHPTWDLFHIFTANIIEPTFDEAFKNECIDLFTNICNGIPCMFCRFHASEYMKTAMNKDEIKTARDLELFFWKFHNEVNERSRKILFPQENLTDYKRKNVKNIIKEFRNTLVMYYRNDSLLTQFNTFVKKNENNFTYYEMTLTPVITNTNTNPKIKPNKDSNANANPKIKPKIKPNKDSNANTNPKKNTFTMLFQKFTKK